jgi:hypothetical protein
MTWVFGSPTWLGSSVCVADIQVTVGGQTFDCLRKLYGLDRNVIAGFAGNVKTGFAMLAKLQQLVDAGKSSPDGPADIEALIDAYPGVARDLFASLPDELRAGGSEILVAGAEPAAGTLYGSRSRAVRFLGPSFAVQEIPHREWASIGSGSGILAYLAELEKVTGEAGDGLVQMETGLPGGHALMMARFVAMQIADLPSIPGISKHFHIGVVFADGWQITNSDRDFFPPDGPPKQIRMPRFASSWAELEELLGGRVSADLSIAVA